MVGKVRMSGPTLKVLKVFVGCSTELCGSEVRDRILHPAGTVFPLLWRLEAAGWLRSRWEKEDPSGLGRPRRCFYQITVAGRKAAIETITEYSL